MSAPSAAVERSLADKGDITGQLDRPGLLMLSAERDLWSRRLLAAELAAYDRGRADGFDEGWTAAEDYDEREHQAVAARVLETPQQSIARRLTAAAAGSRRDAAEHWRKRWAELHRLSRDRKFVRAAYAEQPRKRSYEQIMAILLSSMRRSAA